MKKICKALLILLSLTLLLSGCSSTEPADNSKGNTAETGEPQYGGTYIMVSNGEPSSFNPNWKTDDMQLPATYNIFNRLVKITLDNTIVPDLATSWEFSEDGTELTFQLRDDVRWHDGEDFNSEDVVWTFEKILTDGYQSASLSNVESVTANGDYEVVFHLKTPDASILSVLSWLGVWIMPEHLYNDGTDWTQNPHNMNPVGTGPFKFVSYDTGSSITLEANEDYFDGRPYIDTLIITIIPDAQTAYQSYINGEIDDIQSRTPAASLQDLINDTANYRTYDHVGTSRTYLSFAMNDPECPFSDVRVRQAVNLALDRTGIVEKADKGFGAPSEYYISPVFDWALSEEYKIPQRDLEEAQRLIEEAGYTKGADGYYFECELTTFDSGSFKDTATVIQDNLREIGINVRLNILEIGAWMTKVIDNYDFDIAMCSGGQGPDISAIRNRVHTTGSLNLSRYSNPELDAAIDTGITFFDEEERKPYYVEVQRIISEDLPIVPISDYQTTYPVKSYIHGHPFEYENSGSYNSYEMAKVWIEQ